MLRRRGAHEYLNDAAFIHQRTERGSGPVRLLARGARNGTKPSSIVRARIHAAGRMHEPSRVVECACDAPNGLFATKLFSNREPLNSRDLGQPAGSSQFAATRVRMSPDSCQCTRSTVKPNPAQPLVRTLTTVAGIAVVAILGGSTSALAQSDCEVGQLDRRGPSERRLAIKVGDEWQFFPQNLQGPAHILEADSLQPVLCMAWEAPSHLGLSRQVVYASTQYADQQPLSLFRRGFGPGGGRPVRGSVNDLADDFKAYHRQRSSIQGVLREDLDVWHERAASYDLVSGAVTSSRHIPYGAERLLTLLPLRSRKSWVRLTSHAPPGEQMLRVAIAYSGDRELGPHAYQYLFEIGN